MIINQDDQNTSTVVLGGDIALTGPLEIRVGGGGGNGGIARLDGLISNNQSLTKTQNGVLWLNNPGNSFDGALNVNVGTLRVTQNGVLGTTVGATNVATGAVLQFDGGVTYTTPETVNLSGNSAGGTIANLSGNNIFDGDIQIVTTSTLSTPVASTFTGGDIGEGLDLDGDFLYAVNVRGPSVPAIRDATFLDEASVPNVVLTSNANILNWQTPAFGSTSNDDNLEVVMQSIRHGNADPGFVNAVLNGLTPGTSYKLQLLIYENNPNRRTGILFDGVTIAQDYTGGIALNVGGVFTLEFLATATSHTVRLDSTTTTAAYDGNPVLQALSLEQNTGYTGPTGKGTLNAIAGNLRLNGQISGSRADLIKSGAGSVGLSGNNSYSGTTTIKAGTLFAIGPGSNTVLGLPSGATIVNAGATLGLADGINLSGETITATGNGAAGQPGAIVNHAGTNTLGSDVFASDLRIAANTGTTLNISGNINTAALPNISFDAAANSNINLTGKIVETSGSIALNGVVNELEIWLDASDINGNGTSVANGALITTWKDKSGKGRDFDLPVGDPNYVLASTHGQPAVNFDGNDAIQLNPLHNPRNFIDGNGEFTIISMARYSGATQGRVIAPRTSHNWLFGFHGGSSNRNGHYDGWGSQDPAPIGVSGDQNWHLHANQMNVFSDATNPAGDWFRDGLRLTNDGRGTGDAFTNNVPDGLQLGAWNGLSEVSTAEVSELIMYNRVLSDAELFRVEAYLAAKYGLPIPVTMQTGITKLGLGTVTFAGDNNYTVPTIVSAGTLVAAHSTALGTAAAGVTVRPVLPWDFRAIAQSLAKTSSSRAPVPPVNWEPLSILPTPTP